MVFLRKDTYTSPLKTYLVLIIAQYKFNKLYCIVIAHFLPLSNNIVVNGLWQIQAHLKNAFAGHGGRMGMDVREKPSLHSLSVYSCFINVNISAEKQLVSTGGQNLFPLAVFQIHVNVQL